jgi:hypothetical protein
MERVKRQSRFEKLVIAIVPLGILHHIDHVLRGDHAGWPFRPEVTAFTFTLLIYPILAVAWKMRARPRIRAGLIGVVAAFVLVAHTLIEPPQQIYGTWAYNRSTDAFLYTVDPEHVHNLLNIESPLLGAIAASLSVVLTALIIVASLVATRDAQQRVTR